MWRRRAAGTQGKKGGGGRVREAGKEGPISRRDWRGKGREREKLFSSAERERKGEGACE